MSGVRTFATLALPFLLAAGEPAMFRGGPEHLGVYPSAKAPSLASVRWRFRTGGKVLSSPAVKDGTV